MINGIFPPIPSPFIDDELAVDKLKDNVTKWYKTGINGYVIMGSNGESAYLTKKEKIKICSTVNETKGNNLLLIAGTGSDSVKDTIELTNLAADNGADYGLLLTPSFYKAKMNHFSFMKYFSDVADKVNIPIIIYNVPKFTGVSIESKTVSELSKHKNIAGIKHSSENLGQMAEFIYETEKDFSVLVGTASVLYAGLSLGASGGILALANIAPRECVEIYNLVKKNQTQDALALQLKLLEANKAVTGQYGIAGLKAALDILGYFGGEPRSPLLKLEENEINNLKQILSKTELI